MLDRSNAQLDDIHEILDKNDDMTRWIQRAYAKMDSKAPRSYWIRLIEMRNVTKSEWRQTRMNMRVYVDMRNIQLGLLYEIEDRSTIFLLLIYSFWFALFVVCIIPYLVFSSLPFFYIATSAMKSKLISTDTV